jgi:hypothetical protein
MLMDYSLLIGVEEVKEQFKPAYTLIPSIRYDDEDRSF